MLADFIRLPQQGRLDRSRDESKRTSSHATCPTIMSRQVAIFATSEYVLLTMSDYHVIIKKAKNTRREPVSSSLVQQDGFETNGIPHRSIQLNRD